MPPFVIFSSLYRRTIVILAAVIVLAMLSPTARGATPAKTVSKTNPAEAVRFWQSARAELAEAPENELALKRAAASAQLLEKDSATGKLAIRAYRDLSGILSQSNDERVAARAPKFAGVARRLGLVGHPMKIVGTLVGGRPFDTSQWKGKVVLVDFWATWCGPCRKELPNVKRNFQKYHARGFEVVGVSLDTDVDTLREFLSTEQIRWPVLVGQEETGAGWDSPLAVYYGVQSVPTAILIDQNGEVVSLNARGTELTRRLEELLGN